MPGALNLSTLWARVLIDELARCGLRHAVIAPGARSSPLAFACADHPDVSDASVIDERSAAFVALGLARATGLPAAVLCTSGTAAANLLPAVTEADRSGVPLVALTADRPARLRDAGDSQTADQVKLFGDRVRWFHQTPEAGLEAGKGEATLRALRTAAGHAWARALGAAGPPGPVHLNLPFDKPLEPTQAPPGTPGALPPGSDPESPSSAAAGRPGGAPWLRIEPPGAPEVPPETVGALARSLAGARRPLLLAGALPAGTDLPPALARLLDVLPLPVWAEAASGLRTAPETAGRVVGTAELLLASERFRDLLRGDARPDLVLRLGEAPIGWAGRRFSAALADDGVEQVAVDPWGRRRDPEHGVSRIVAAGEAALLDALAEHLERNPAAPPPEPAWLALHRTADRAAREALDREAGAIDELFDGGVFHRLRTLLPEDAALFVSSSMPLRELELFLPGLGSGREGSGPVDLFANRGLNGIDGVTSTALGVALGRRIRPGEEGGSRTVLVTGDVAFAHDLSGALAAGRLAAPSTDRGAGRGSSPAWDLTVVLVDNGGGAIFDHLPAAGREPGFERHLATPPGADFEALARGCGLGYEAPSTGPAFEDAFARSLGSKTSGSLPVRVLHVRTGRHRSRALREQIVDRVAARVDAGISDGLETAADPSPRDPIREAGPVELDAPLLFLHGFTGCGADWAGLTPALGLRPILTPDLPGHGRAPVPAAGATLDECGAAVLQELDRRGVERAHLVGYSMGGRLALALAVRHPERLSSLTLIGAGPGIADDAARAERRERDEALAREIERDGLEAFVDRWMGLPLFASQSRLGHRFLRRARLRRLAGSARGYAAALRGMGQGAQPSFRDELPRIETPTLLIAGALDEKYTRIAHEMSEALPKARLEIVPDAGHAVHLEAPDAVAALIREHVSRR